MNVGSASSSALRAALPAALPPPGAGGAEGGCPGGCGAAGAGPSCALLLCCLRQAISSINDIPGGGLGAGLLAVGRGGGAEATGAAVGGFDLPPLIIRSRALCTVTGPLGCAGTLTVSQPPVAGAGAADAADAADAAGGPDAAGVGKELGLAACCCSASPSSPIGDIDAVSPGAPADWDGDECFSSSSASFWTIELSVASSSLVGTWCRLCLPPSTSCSTSIAGGNPFFFLRFASRCSTAASSASMSSSSPKSVSPTPSSRSFAADAESSDAHAAISSPPCRPRYRRS